MTARRGGCAEEEMRQLLRFTMVGVLLVLPVVGSGQELQPYVDRGACPGECCRYGKWRALADVMLYDEPAENAEEIGVVPGGRRVRALTGEVHTVPGLFRVHREHEKYRRGDVIEVLTYVGEGFFKVRFDGEIYQEDLGFSPWGGIPDSRCSDVPSCYGELDRELDFTWWVKLRMLDGEEGWIRDPEAFRGMDACG